MNKAILKSIMEDARGCIRPMNCEIICTPYYAFDWSIANDNAKNKWIATASFCSTLGHELHANVISPCKPAFDKNYNNKEKIWFIKQICGEIKHLLPPPQYLKTKALAPGT